MAESTRAASAAHDGRFGERFDQEVSVSGVVWTTVGLAVACVLGMLITWFMLDEANRSEGAETPVAGEARPAGPILQTDPEGELEIMRHEMAERLGGYGWVDEGAGVVHIPIDEAMDLLVERGSVAVGGAVAADETAEATQ